MALPPLATLDDLAAYRGEPIDPEDTTALFHLRTASGVVRAFLGQEVAPVVTSIVTLEVGPRGVVVLPELPVREVSLVEAPVGVGWEALPAEGLAVNPVQGIITGVPVPWCRVTYTHGVDQGDVPDAIVAAVVSIAARAEATPAGVSREQIGTYSVQYGAAAAMALSAEEYAMLKPYQVTGVAR